MEFDFNAQEVPDQQAFEVLPFGWYAATVEEIEKKDNKAGTGWYFNLKIKIDENVHPQVGSRVVYAIITMDHPNQKAVSIGASQMKRICIAVGKPNGIKDTDEILYRPIAVKLKIKPETPQYPARNEVADYDTVANRITGNAPASSDPFPASTGGGEAKSATPASGSTPNEKPWMRR